LNWFTGSAYFLFLNCIFLLAVFVEGIIISNQESNIKSQTNIKRDSSKPSLKPGEADS